MRFNLLLALAAVVAFLFPATGQTLAHARTAMIVVVMFLMALTLPGEHLRSALGNVRGLAACTLLSWLLVPVLCVVAARSLFADSPGLEAGMVVLGALPCTLASASVWTRLGRGDDALSLVYTVVSNLASVLVLPALVLLALGRSVEAPFLDMARGLALVVLLPVLAGQALRLLVGARVDRQKKRVSVVAQALVLGIVMVAVSRMQPAVLEEPVDAVVVVAVAAVIHVVALAAAGPLGRLLGLPLRQRRAVVFAGTQKTLFVGVYVAAEYFGDLPLALLPVAAYHVTQLLIDTVVAGRMASSQDACSPSSST